MGKKCLSTASVCVCVCVCVVCLAPQDGSQVEWLLEVLNGGLGCTEDYRLYQRKRLLPHLMTLYTGPAINSKAKVSLAGYFQTESFFFIMDCLLCVCVCVQALILQSVLRACLFPVAVSDLVWTMASCPGSITSPGEQSSSHPVLKLSHSVMCGKQ